MISMHGGRSFGLGWASSFARRRTVKGPRMNITWLASAERYVFNFVAKDTISIVIMCYMGCLWARGRADS